MPLAWIMMQVMTEATSLLSGGTACPVRRLGAGRSTHSSKWPAIVRTVETAVEGKSGWKGKGREEEGRRAD